MLKAKAITQAEVDEREAEALAEQEQNEAIATIRDRQVTLARLTLAFATVLWPKLSADERSQIRAALPDEDEQMIRAALAKIKGNHE